MISSALNKFTSNISSNYSVASQPSSFAGPWKIFDGKHRLNKKLVSIFVFDRKSLDPGGTGRGFGQSRGSGTSLRKAHDEVVERLRKEASALARLRHPSILELVEPVEDTRNGGLIFATEPVSASLASLLAMKDERGDRGTPSSHHSRHIKGDVDTGGRAFQDVDIDELEIQKGLLQVGKGLEFLHESAGLVHANLTPEAIFINSKSDWKISGLGFSSPPDQSSKATTFIPISLSEVLNYDPRLPRSVQLNLNFTSPDFILDSSISSAADMFSLGLIIIAMYNKPHQSPIESEQSISNYKRIFSSPSTIPTVNNNFQTKQILPRDIKSEILPRLITRRPTNRFGAREFQQARYFDNILVSTIRFLDNLPAKTANEKSQFLRGLPRILSQFPKSVLEKKVLPVLLDETKDTRLLSLTLQNAFKVIEMLPEERRAFTQRMVPTLKSVFDVAGKLKGPQERDSTKEGGLMVVIENMNTITSSSSGKEFKDDVLPILYHAFESSTIAVVDAALSVLPQIIPVLDFSTIKNELFPVVASVFSKTSSMAIKIRSLKSLFALCGGVSDPPSNNSEDFLSTQQPLKKTLSSSTLLDKYTVQEKVVPLLKGIKTKEPAVMMAALDVFNQVGLVADPDFLALEVLPTLWGFALGPLLNLEQFRAFMALINSLSSKIEQEQSRRLKDLASTSRRENNGVAHSNANGISFDASYGSGNDTDFEALVTGRKAGGELVGFDPVWSNTTGISQPHSISEVSEKKGQFDTSSHRSRSSVAARPTGAITPDSTLSSFASLMPNQPASLSSPRIADSFMPLSTVQHQSSPLQQKSKAIDWTSAKAVDTWSSQAASRITRQHPRENPGAVSQQHQHQQSPLTSFNLNTSSLTSSSNVLENLSSSAMMADHSTDRQGKGHGIAQNPQKKGMEKYESLI